MPNAHQWLVNPQAIEVWAHTAPALCSEPKCYLAAKYQVAFPRQAPVLFCSRHTKLTIRRAIGQVADLGKMLAATAERDGQVLRHGARSHIHWPQGARVDDQMEALGDMMPKRDLGYCGAYVAVRFLAGRPRRSRALSARGRCAASSSPRVSWLLRASCMMDSIGEPSHISKAKVIEIDAVSFIRPSQQSP